MLIEECGTSTKKRKKETIKCTYSEGEMIIIIIIKYPVTLLIISDKRVDAEYKLKQSDSSNVDKNNMDKRKTGGIDASTIDDYSRKCARTVRGIGFAANDRLQIAGFELYITF